MQVIPHITNEIKHRIRRMATDDVDVVITEVGGTVGDIESLPFLEAVRQVRHEVGRDNVFVVHISLLPYIGPSGELKTKPTQHSVAALRNIGIQPDAIVLRADREVPTAHQAQDLADVRRGRGRRGRLPSTPSRSTTSPRCCTPRAWTPTSCAGSDLPFRDVDWTEWDDLLRRVHHPDHEVTVALVGKYIDLPDAYLSVTEALRAGGFANNARVKIKWVTSDDCRTPAGAAAAARRRATRSASPAASASAASTARSARSRYARENKVPLLGLCLGLQCIVIEAARNLAGIDGRQLHRVRRRPPRTRSSPPWPSSSTSSRARATWAAPCGWACTRPSSPRARIVREVYGGEPYVEERHRHRYEVNNAYRAELEKKAGLVFSGTSPGQQARRVRRATRATSTPTWSPPRPTPSCAPGRPGRTRSSPAWSRRPWSARQPPRDGREAWRTVAGVRPARRAPVSAADGRTSHDASRTRPRSGRSPRPRPRSRATRPASAPTRWSCRTAPSSAATTRSTPAPWPSSPSTTRTGCWCSRQYRHPVRQKLWEIPAGLLDVPGENPLHAAQRELYEEAHVKAEDWRVLVDVYTTPGGCDEAVRIFLARDLSEAEGERFEVSEEEADMELARVPLRGARARACWPASCTTTASSWACCRCAARSSGDGLDALRPAEAPWPARPFEA